MQLHQLYSYFLDRETAFVFINYIQSTSTSASSMHFYNSLSKYEMHACMVTEITEILTMLAVLLSLQLRVLKLQPPNTKHNLLFTIQFTRS